VSDALEVAADLLGVARLDDAEPLGGSDRSSVWRAATPDGPVVVKTYAHPERLTWRREAAGLLAAGGAASPRLLAVSEEPAVVVMSDLGDGGSLADLLLGRDPLAAGRGLVAWADALTRLHRGSRERHGEFVDALGDGLTPHATREDVDGFAHRVLEQARSHDLPWDARVPDAVAEVGGPLWEPDPLVLTPGDACPDNNVITPDGLRLLDFEFAELRHPAWDAAYLRVPWPSCWCAWQVPESEAASAYAVFREAAPGAATGFEEAVEAATLLWCLTSSSWFLASALEDVPHNTDDDRKPGRRTMILGRLALASRMRGPAVLTSYAAELRRVLLDRWGPHPLALAPAFRTGVSG
jgi:hypothetical protein